MTIVKICKTDPSLDIKIPEYKTTGAAGFDLSASHDVYVWPGEVSIVRTGLMIELPEGFEMQIRPRSGLSKHGILTIFGTVDSDYRGEVCVLLTTLGPERYFVCCGDRIAQGVVAKVERAGFQVTVELNKTIRGSGGFGSTGR